MVRHRSAIKTVTVNKSIGLRITVGYCLRFISGLRSGVERYQGHAVLGRPRLRALLIPPPNAGIAGHF
jgi:hypothetical protein